MAVEDLTWHAAYMDEEGNALHGEVHASPNSA
jgi:hypothetical protein